ncbi:hypothetical protein [Actinoplanes friuliensis]|uniref:Integral membrane protein n=1 Tax=Actinoplanes friuliensis DSM 7358 TaxID=1246995 RepID=U5VVV6_9ACTN|nr:hypothetical protein [Actinoplanes friuliensis]AGZ41093.1 hypothetical protein AFR_14035 [Actinoplanes friuliensis DSM 7358]
MDMDHRPGLRLVGADERMAVPRARRDPARWALAAVAVLQILLGTVQILGLHAVDLVNGGHVGNESAAWNIALGAAFLGVARAGTGHAGVLIMLAAFIGVLTVLTVSDLLSGRVGSARLGTHALLVLGFCLVLRLTRRPRPAPQSADRPGTRHRWVTTNAANTPWRNGHHAKHPEPRLPAAYPRRSGTGRRTDHARSRRLR